MDDDLRARAKRMIGQKWNNALAMRYSSLESLNEALPAGLRFRTKDEVVRQWLAEAHAISQFALSLDLVSSADDAEFRKQVQSEMPEVAGWGVWAVCPKCGGKLESVAMFSGRRPDNGERGGGTHWRCQVCLREYLEWLTGGPRLMTEERSGAAQLPIE